MTKTKWSGAVDDSRDAMNYSSMGVSGELRIPLLEADVREADLYPRLRLIERRNRR